MNLLETVRNYLTPDLIDRVTNHLNESHSGVSKALSAAVPALLAGFVHRAESGDAPGLLKDAHEAVDANVLSDPQGLFSGGSVGSFASGGWDRVQGMLGSGGKGIASAVANFAGIKSGSVQSLLAMLAPLGLGVLGRHAREQNLSADGLASYLSSQKSSIMSALPAGFSLGNLFGHQTNLGRTATTENLGRNVEERAKNTNWLLWLVLALVAIALLWYFLGKGCNKPAENTTVSDTTATATPVITDTTSNRTTTTRSSTTVKLAGGTEINAYAGGVEDQLVNCLNDAGCTPGKDKWFDFDNINFETGSAQLTSESNAQISNIAAILKAYPKAKIKIGGYTDKTGNDAANKRLSQQRADAVMNAIKSAGAGSGQLVGAEGYGSAFAKEPATASDEERRKDRRIAVQLRAK